MGEIRGINVNDSNPEGYLKLNRIRVNHNALTDELEMVISLIMQTNERKS